MALKPEESVVEMQLEAVRRGEMTIPDELAGPLPRSVSFGSDDGRYLIMIILLFGGFFTIAGPWTCFHDYRELQKRDALRADHRVVVGEVAELRSGRGWSSVRYRFSVNDKTFEGEAVERNGLRLRLRESDLILIRFLPYNPSINHPDAWEWSPWMNMEWVGKLFLVFAGSVGYGMLFVLLRQRGLARGGIAAIATVIGCVASDRSFRIDYEFRAQDGALIHGRGDRGTAHEIGAPVVVLYFPRNPRRNSLYPLDFYAVAG